MYNIVSWHSLNYQSFDSFDIPIIYDDATFDAACAAFGLN